MGDMLGAIQVPALFVFGGGDHVISVDDVLRVRCALQSGKRSYRIRLFPDVPHGWLNDTMSGRYWPEAAEQAWSMLLTFLDDVLQKRWPGVGRMRWKFESNVAPTYGLSKNRRLA